MRVLKQCLPAQAGFLDYSPSLLLLFLMIIISNNSPILFTYQS